MLSVDYSKMVIQLTIPRSDYDGGKMLDSSQVMMEAEIDFEDVENYVLGYFKHKSESFCISIQKLFARIKVVSKFYGVNWQSFQISIDNLVAEKRIVRSGDDISLNENNFLSKICDIEGEDYTIISLRCEGKNYSDITRLVYPRGEFKSNYLRVRKALNSFKGKTRGIFEEKYIEIYQHFEWNQEQFIKVFRESRYTFNYLRCFYNAGCYRIPDEFAQNLVLDEFRSGDEYFVFKGQKLIFSKRLLFDVLCPLLARTEINKEKFASLILSQIHASEKIVSKINSPQAFSSIIFSSNHSLPCSSKTFRYYDKDCYMEKYSRQIQRIFEVKKGVYSAELLFRKNKNLVDKLGLRNPYEFYYFTKSVLAEIGSNNSVRFYSQPYILIGFEEVNDFFYGIIRKSNNKELNDVCVQLKKDFGLEKSFVKSKLRRDFKSHITIEGRIVANPTKLNKKKARKLRRHLSEPFYKMDDFVEMMIRLAKEPRMNLINEASISSVGYYQYSNLVVKKEIQDIEEYLKEELLKHNFIDFTVERYDFSAYPYKTVINELKDRYDVIRIDEKNYITIRKLKDIGIVKSDLIGFTREIKRLLGKNEFFSYRSVEDSGYTHRFSTFGFDDIFYESILKNTTGIGCIDFCDTNLFHNFRRKATLDDLIEFIYPGNEPVIAIEDFVEKLYGKFGIRTDCNELEKELRKTNYFLEPQLGRVYKTKDDYYREVYDE